MFAVHSHQMYQLSTAQILSNFVSMASLRPWNLFGKTIYAAANPGRHALVIFFFVSRVPALGGLRLFGGVKTQSCRFGISLSILESC